MIGELSTNKIIINDIEPMPEELYTHTEISGNIFHGFKGVKWNILDELEWLENISTKYGRGNVLGTYHIHTHAGTSLLQPDAIESFYESIYLKLKGYNHIMGTIFPSGWSVTLDLILYKRFPRKHPTNLALYNPLGLDGFKLFGYASIE